MKIATKWRSQQSFFSDEYEQEPGTLIVLHHGRVMTLDLITREVRPAKELQSSGGVRSIFVVVNKDVAPNDSVPMNTEDDSRKKPRDDRDK